MKVISRDRKLTRGPGRVYCARLIWWTTWPEARNPQYINTSSMEPQVIHRERGTTGKARQGKMALTGTKLVSLTILCCLLAPNSRLVSQAGRVLNEKTPGVPLVLSFVKYRLIKMCKSFIIMTNMYTRMIFCSLLFFFSFYDHFSLLSMDDVWLIMKDGVHLGLCCRSWREFWWRKWEQPEAW